MRSLRINAERLQNNIRELAKFGLNVQTGGLDRTTFTEAELAARQWLKSKLLDLQLRVRVDEAANICHPEGNGTGDYIRRFGCYGVSRGSGRLRGFRSSRWAEDFRSVRKFRSCRRFLCFRQSTGEPSGDRIWLPHRYGSKRREI